MSRDQQAARINVSDDEWIEFRTIAMRKRRSIADYLGELVRRELDGSKEPANQSQSEKSDRPPPALSTSRSTRRPGAAHRPSEISL